MSFVKQFRKTEKVPPVFLTLKTAKGTFCASSKDAINYKTDGEGVGSGPPWPVSPRAAAS